jgi:truncated hemoglobin YjbI
VTLEAALLHEVSVIQRDKTLLLVRDAIDSIPVDMEDRQRSWGRVDRKAVDFKRDLLHRLETLKEG